MKINISAVTDVGKERTNNEDAFSFCPNIKNNDWSLSDTNGFLPLDDYGMVAVVADGMGGANAGEVASSLAIKVTKESFKEANLSAVTKSSECMRTMMESVVRKINHTIQDHVTKEPDTIGMGTTIVMLWITPNKTLAAWCGDSRCYRFSPKKGLIRISKDHSYVQSLIDNGEITERQALTHEDNSIITRCLGDADTQSEPEFINFSVDANEMIILCSDGLCGYCMDSEIEKVIYQNFTDATKCKDALLKLAYDKGGQDNITIIAMSTISDKEENPHISKFSYIKNRLRRCFRT